ncbi:histidinol-phosphate aminotransferase [Kiloniella litopenaei]|uniref:Histidinol-phosphate aminotransferase n=1 Tax=Kiloniella litopenaei TaxID=1549748 RepID=A0A0M2RE55_9PROT|nr:histidinol-phosphate transaminase [Kiloniella litopenaei]KKJ77843.1 histidinol-phosphate aminotransferase [Kiloniella litopenaei]
MALKPQPGIMDVSPYVGGESKVEGVDRICRLASNENPLGASDAAKKAYLAIAEDLHRYPDGGSYLLRTGIAEAEDLDAERIVCGAGSDELLGLLINAYVGVDDEVVYNEHGFLMYPIGTKIAGGVPVKANETDLRIDIDAMLAAVTDKTRIMFLANPNNPTGSYITETELRRLRAELRDDVLLVIDAAYCEYVDNADYINGAALVEENDNVVMTRTFSKIHGLASLRLGWAYCSAEVADVLNRVRGPFNVSLAAQSAGVAAIKDKEHITRSKELNNRLLNWFRQQVSELGLGTHDSVGNFVLVNFGSGERAAEALAFLKNKGVLVRGMSAYGLAEHIRISIGTEEEMRVVVDSLTAFIND